MSTAASGLPAGYRLAELGRTDSTNMEAQRRFAAGERGPLWIRAQSQDAGRGRKGRQWVSDPGNLFASLLISLDVPVAAANQLSFVAGLAVQEALSTFAPSTCRVLLKWPNDVLLNGRKAAGILVESLDGAGNAASAFAIGCGLNIAHAPQEARYPATALNAEGAHATAGLVFGQLTVTMVHWISLWNCGAGFDRISAAWRDRAAGLGEPQTVNLGRECVTGVFEGLGPDGAMLLRLPDNSQRALYFGDVSHASSSEPALSGGGT